MDSFTLNSFSKLWSTFQCFEHWSLDAWEGSKSISANSPDHPLTTQTINPFMITLLTFKKFEYSPYLKIKKKRREIKDMRKDTHDHKLIAAARDVNKFQLKSALVLGTTRELHEMWSEHFNIVYVIERIFVLFTSLFMTLNSSDRSWDSWLVRRNCWKRRLSECETSSWCIPYSCRKIGYKPSRLLGVWRLVSISRFFRLNVLFNRIYMALQSNSLAHSSFFNNWLSSNWSQMTFKGGKNK